MPPSTLAEGPGTSARRRKFDTAVARWASIGPYYAMFPVDFAFDVVARYSRVGDAVLDPFAGRASSVYAAAALGRHALGIEINPVGWLYGYVKLRPASQARVLRRLTEVADSALAESSSRSRKTALPPFYAAAYAPTVLRFLLAARTALAWRTSRTDATLMAFILVYLHGKREAALSNQMRDGKAMAPEYAVRWWTDRRMRPPEIDPLTFLRQRIEWRYKHGAPAFDASMRLGDSIRVLRNVARSVEQGERRSFNLLFTSPPYRGVTNYHSDQWLRLWMLGGAPDASAMVGKWQRRFESGKQYRELLEGVFGGAAPSLAQRATVYVRTDARDFTLAATLETLRAVFPRKSLSITKRPLMGRSQTALYGDTSEKPGEVDIVLTG